MSIKINKCFGFLLLMYVCVFSLRAQDVNFYKKKKCEAAYLHHLLMLACSHDDEVSVKILLAKGADPSGYGYENYVDCVNLPYEFTSPLSLAVSSNSISILKLLLKHKANPNVLEGEGVTPIVSAIREGKMEMVKLLLKHGAKIDIQAKWYRPIDIAKKYKRHKILELLKEYEKSNSSKKKK